VITFTTQLNKTADCAKNVQNSPTVSSFVLKVITSRDATQLDKTVLLSWVASGDVITFKTQLNKTVLLSSVASGDVIEA